MKTYTSLKVRQAEKALATFIESFDLPKVGWRGQAVRLPPKLVRQYAALVCELVAARDAEEK